MHIGIILVLIYFLKVEVAQQQLASYRAYQQRELEEGHRDELQRRSSAHASELARRSSDHRDELSESLRREREVGRAGLQAGLSFLPWRGGPCGGRAGRSPSGGRRAPPPRSGRCPTATRAGGR